jgi:hypothetical protein
MSLSQLAGAISGLLAAGLVLIGLLILLPVSVRLLFAIRRPGKARVAKAFAAFGLALLLCGTLLFLAADLTTEYPSFRHLLDSASPVLAGLAFVLAIGVGIRAGRRRPPARTLAADAAATGQEPPGAEREAGTESPAARDG